MKNKIIIASVFLGLIFLISSVYAYNIQVEPRGLTPNDMYYYTFNFSSDPNGNNVIFSYTTTTVTDDNGNSIINIPIPDSALNQSLNYMLEYRNNVFRIAHNLSNLEYILGNINAQSGYFQGNLTASNFCYSNGTCLNNFNPNNSWTTNTDQSGLTGIKQGSFIINTSSSGYFGNLITGNVYTSSVYADYFYTANGLHSISYQNGLWTFTNGLNVFGNIYGNNICYSNGTNCVLGISSYNNIVLNNQSNDMNGHSLNNVSTLGLTTSSSSNSESASFTGSQYISVPNSNSLNVGNNFTLSVWVYPYDLADQSYISKYNAVSGQGYALFIEGGTLYFQAGNGVVWAFLTASYDVSGWSTNNWYNVVVTYDGTTANLYINNNLVSTQIVSMNLVNTNAEMDMGRAVFSADHYLNGRLDEVQIYNKTLSSGEITSIYNSGTGTCGTSGNSLVAGYHLDGDTNDFSGNSNTGSWTGGSSYTPDSINVCSSNSSTSIVNITYNNGLLCNGNPCASLGNSYWNQSGDNSTIYPSNSQNVLINGTNGIALQVNGAYNNPSVNVFNGNSDAYNFNYNVSLASYNDFNYNGYAGLFQNSINGGIKTYLDSYDGSGDFGVKTTGKIYADAGGSEAGYFKANAFTASLASDAGGTPPLTYAGLFDDGVTETRLNDGTNAIKTIGNALIGGNQIVDPTNTFTDDGISTVQVNAGSNIYGFHETEGKFIVDSTSGPWGQFQLANPTAGEVSVVFASNATIVGDTSLSSSSNNYIWAFGAGTFGVTPDHFTIGNVGYGTYILDIDSNTGTVSAPAYITGGATWDGNSALQVGGYNTGNEVARFTDSNIGSGYKPRVLINNPTDDGKTSLQVNGNITQNGNVVCDSSGNCGSSGTYNSTYNTLLNQDCPNGQVVNGTYSNGTFKCTTVSSSGMNYTNIALTNQSNNFGINNITAYSFSGIGIPTWSLQPVNIVTKLGTFQNTNMTLPLNANATYEVVVELSGNDNSSSVGSQFGLNYSGTGTLEAGMQGSYTSVSNRLSKFNSINDGGIAFWNDGNVNQSTLITGIITTTTSGNVTVMFYSVTTSPTRQTLIQQNSFLKVTRII